MLLVYSWVLASLGGGERGEGGQEELLVRLGVDRTVLLSPVCWLSLTREPGVG